MTLTPEELDRRVAEIGDETGRRLGAVEWDGRYGDWEAFERKQREMFAIVADSVEQKRRLQPAPEVAAAYGRYLEELDRLLVLERALLDAVEAHDMEAVQERGRTLALSVQPSRDAAAAAGLRSQRTPLVQRARLRLTLPFHILKAFRHARAEHAAGRSWPGQEAVDGLLPVHVMLMTALATASVDWALRAVARWQDAPELDFLHGRPPVALLLFFAVFAWSLFHDAVVRPVSPTMNYGSGVLLGGVLATLGESMASGGVTTYFEIAGRDANLGVLAVGAGVVMVWGGAAVFLLRRRLRPA